MAERIAALEALTDQCGECEGEGETFPISCPVECSACGALGRVPRAPQTELTDEIQFETQWGHSLGGIDPVHPMPERAARFMAFGQGRAYKRTIQVGSWVVLDDEGAEKTMSKRLHNKFKVERTDGSSADGGRHDRGEYFVLDLTHDPIAREASLHYASLVDDLPFGAELREWVRSCETQEGNTDNE